MGWIVLLESEIFGFGFGNVMSAPLATAVAIAAEVSIATCFYV